MLLLLWNLMISKNKIKSLKTLKVKKYRIRNKKALLEGRRLIDEAINSGSDIETVWFTQNALDHNANNPLIDKIKSQKIIYDDMTLDDLEELSNTENSQGIIAEISIEKYADSKINNLKEDNLLILDGLSDPGNLGTVLRTCAWYNIKSVILTSNCVDPFNLKCLRSGVGAHFYFDDIIHAEREDVVKYLSENNYDVHCAAMEGQDISDVTLNNKWAIILGSEAHGLHDDFNVFNSITIPGDGKIESLNASVACGIILDRLINK